MASQGCARGAGVISHYLLPPLNTPFRTVPPSSTELAACFGIGSIVFFAVELEKIARRRRSGD